MRCYVQLLTCVSVTSIILQADGTPSAGYAAVNFATHNAKRAQQRHWSSFKNLWLHVGSHADPIISADPDTLTIAVEPDPFTAARIPFHPRVQVLVSAFGNSSSVAEFHTYHEGLSSSLGTATPAMRDLFTYLDGEFADFALLVPVLPLATLLRFLAQKTHIQLLLTDMQGMDFSAVSSAALELPEVFSSIDAMSFEADCRGKSSYNGLANSIENEWIPFMSSTGNFVVLSHGVSPSGMPSLDCSSIGETDMFWQNTRATVPFQSLRTLTGKGVGAIAPQGGVLVGPNGNLVLNQY